MYLKMRNDHTNFATPSLPPNRVAEQNTVCQAVSLQNMTPSLHRTPPPPKGFTLIEIMLAIAIIGVLAAIVLPAYTGYIKQSRVSSLVHNWDTAIAAVRTEAAYLGTPGGSCRDLIAMLNSGNRKGVGNGSVPAFVTSGSDAGSVVINGLGANNCPDNGETVTITANPAPGTLPADYPDGAAPSTVLTIE